MLCCVFRSEAAVHALQKEQGELQQRLTDMTNGMTLLRDLTDLHTKYAAHCDAHPDLPPTVRMGTYQRLYRYTNLMLCYGCQA